MRWLIVLGVVFASVVAILIGLGSLGFQIVLFTIPGPVPSPSPITDTTAKRNEQDASSVQPTNISPPLIADYGQPGQWLTFNQNYQSPNERNFRFKYPSVLEVKDADSGSVWIKKNDYVYLTVEERASPSRYYSTKEFDETISEDEKFRAYYFAVESIFKDFPELTFERIALRKNDFLYKITSEHTVTTYMGEIDGHGIEIIDLNVLPQDVLLDIIWSIEFRSSGAF